jgi:PAS domain S-box-containing protein
MPRPLGIWLRLSLGGVAIAIACLSGWVAVERVWFQSADASTLHRLYLARGFTSSILLMIYAGFFVAWQRRRYERALERAVERQTAELRRQGELHRHVVTNALDAILLADGLGLITHVNPAAERMFGVPPGAATGRPRSEYLVPSTRGAGSSVLEGVGRRPDGTPFPVEYAESAWSEGGDTVSMCIVRDISERRRQAEALRQTSEQLQHAQRLDSVGRLAGGVAHDFNNLLTAVLGYADLLEMRLPDAATAEIGEIRSAAQRAAALTRQLLAFSRKQVLQPAALDLNEVLTAMNGLLRRLIPESVTLDLRPAAGLGTVWADRGQIEQVLMNLVINAKDAMKDGGTVTIETANAELDASYASRHQEVVPGPHVMFCVSDTGSGMDAATQAKLFEPFFTTKPCGKGTGLGLATCHGIVKQSGGHIWVYSEPGHGSTFKVYLPRVAASPSTGSPVGPETRSPRGSETILLVEDDDGVRRVLVTGLRSFGYTVIEAMGAAQAESIVDAQGAAIRLLVTDVVMRERNGRELADSIHRRLPGLPVIFISGYTENAIVHHGVLTPGIDFLEKPLVPATLAKKVREVLDRPESRP